MAPRRDQGEIREDPGPPAATVRHLLGCAASAAGLLEGVCPPGSDGFSYPELVRALARDLEEELEALATITGEDAPGVEVAEGAARAADVANLTACALPEFGETNAPEVAAAAHLAAGAARSLGVLIGPEAGGAVWRARLAARQVDEALEAGQKG